MLCGQRKDMKNIQALIAIATFLEIINAVARFINFTIFYNNISIIVHLDENWFSSPVDLYTNDAILIFSEKYIAKYVVVEFDQFYYNM